MSLSEILQRDKLVSGRQFAVEPKRELLGLIREMFLELYCTSALEEIQLAQIIDSIDLALNPAR